ncbi:deoxyuridine 5'-triphosphate nucleotidohydrolase [Clostridia bacterium]|nr:deoxyuridine 5'-triphosphate nucleotidohydrolase [Clostridia bacterium]
MSIIQIKKLKKTATIPTRATAGSAGMDLYACITEPITINPAELATVPTGIAAALPSSDFALFIFARSGLGVKHGISLSNGVGVVDSDYRGEISVGLCNLGSKPYTIAPNERIAQMVAIPVAVFPITEVAELNETARGTGGFGSTGKA